MRFDNIKTQYQHELIPLTEQREILVRELAELKASRDAFLEEELGRLHDGLRVEALAHASTIEVLRDREQRHSLMVGHEGAHDRRTFPGRHA